MMEQTLEQRCKVALECLPDARYRTMLAGLFEELLARAAVPVVQLQEPVAVDATEQRRALLVGECDWSEVAREPAAGVTAAHPLHMPTDEQFRFMRVPQHENYACEKAAIRLFCRLNGITRRLNAQCTAASAECAATQRHITDMLVAHRDMIEAQQRGDGEAEVLAVRRMEAARSAVAGASPCRPRQTDTGVEQTEPFWCHEQSHDRARCESQCAECAEDGVPVSQESNVVETLRLARLALRNATAPVGNHSARTLIGEALLALDRAIAGVKGLDDAKR
jgi:hypothetical protein